jgi:hypothetical protein
MRALRTRKPEPAPVLDPETPVICTEAFRPGAVARMIEKGDWLHLDHPAVRANPQAFAVPLSRLEGVNEHGN